MGRMLRSMSASEFNAWKAFNELDPFTEERQDYRIASIGQHLWNIARDPRKVPDGWPITDFVVRFGDNLDGLQLSKQAQQTPEYQELLIDSWIAGHNLIEAAKGKAQ